MRTASISVLLLVSLAFGGCSEAKLATSTKTGPVRITSLGVRFVPASPQLIAACRSTARSVGYRVPCPMKVPKGLVGTGYPGPTGCVLHVIGPGGIGGCGKAWRGWVVGSSYAATKVPAAATTTGGYEHLVITASPRPLSNYAKVVNGPVWYPKARVKPLAWVSIGGTRMRAVFVPPDTNDGSSFAQHVVLIWTVGQHTYGVGFHDLTSERETLLLDEELATHIRLVRP
jgi:hypothetical protein